MPIPPSKKVRLAEIALQANCTTATVSMALNDSARLSEATRQRIQSLAKEMGYLPNHVARSLSLGRSGILGVIVPFSIDPYYAAILDSLNLEASRRGYQLHIQFHRWSLEEEEKAIRRMVESRVEGILLYPARADYTETVIGEWLDVSNIPLGMLRDTLAPPTLREGLAGSIRKDFIQEGILLGRELLGQGHRLIDVLELGPKKAFLTRGRYEGVCEAASGYSDARIRFHFEPTKTSDEMASLAPVSGVAPSEYEAFIDGHVRAYLASPERGTAVLTSNPKVAWRLLGMMHRLGIRCPEDVSVATAGIRGAGAEGFLPLTSAEYDPAQIAALAIDALLRCIADRTNTAGEMIVKPELAVRETTGAPPEGSFSPTPMTRPALT